MFDLFISRKDSEEGFFNHPGGAPQNVAATHQDDANQAEYARQAKQKIIAPADLIKIDSGVTAL